MNADTKKKIEDESSKHTPNDFAFCIGAEFGYSLALEHAEDLLKALERIYDELDECLPFARS